MDAPSPRHRSRWYLRIPAKILLFAIVVTLVEFPNPALMIRHIRHLRNMDAMVQPDAPQLAPFEAELRRRIGLPTASQPAPRPVYLGFGRLKLIPPPSGREVLQAVEKFVYEKVQYDWDWNIWGSADYMPTVAEMFARAEQYPDRVIREDCDGRAVMAASLLARLGYPAHLVTDFGHVWVQTVDPDRHRAIELMGPGYTRAVVSTSRGNRFNWSGLANLPRALAYGLTVFPWTREAIVFAALMLLLAHRRMSLRAAAVGVGFAFAGWHLLRTSDNYWSGSMVNAWIGLAFLLIGCAVMMVAARRARAGRSAAIAAP